MKNKILLLVIFISTSLFAQKLTINDILSMDNITSIQNSPDGKYITYVKGVKKDWKSRYNFNIWLYSVEDRSNLQFTTSEKNDMNPKWSPDQKKIGFVSTRGEGAQIYYIDLNGGEAKQLTNVKEGVSSFDWLDNKTVVYTADEPRDSAIVEKEKEAGGAFVVGTNNHMSAIWSQSIDGKPIKITDGSFYISSFSISNDGKYFAVIGATSSDLYENVSNNFVKVLNDKGEVLSTFPEGRAFSEISFSPSGNNLAIVGCKVGFSSSDACWILDVKTGKYKDYTEEFSPTIREMQWINNDNIVFTSQHNTFEAFYDLDLNSGDIKLLFEPNMSINTFSISPNTSILSFVGSRTEKTNQLYFWNTRSKSLNPIQISDLNPEINKRISVTSEMITFSGVNNDPIQALLTLPPGYNKNKSYPLLVLPHGGPDSYTSNRFSSIPILLSQEGFIVYQPNYHGSTGYGSKFYAANRGLEGDIDYKDIMMGVDYMIANGIVDSNKMVVGGWSYGGYMTNWIIGHTNRFKAAVSVAGISNMVSQYAESDINHGVIAQWDVAGVPVLNIENFQRTSPLNYLKNCKTPTLILHGTGDVRVPVGQGWQLYWALKDLNVETKLKLYPTAPHSINNDPRYYADVLTQWIQWYADHMKM